MSYLLKRICSWEFLIEFYYFQGWGGGGELQYTVFCLCQYKVCSCPVCAMERNQQSMDYTYPVVFIYQSSDVSCLCIYISLWTTDVSCLCTYISLSMDYSCPCLCLFILFYFVQLSCLCLYISLWCVAVLSVFIYQSMVCSCPVCVYILFNGMQLSYSSYLCLYISLWT